MIAPRSLGLIEAAALLRVHKNTLAARARARARAAWQAYRVGGGRSPQPISALEKIKFSLTSERDKP